MRRFWLDRSCLLDGEFLIKGSSYHHIVTVSKIKKGEPFEVFVEGYQKYEAALTSISHSKATAKILSVKPASAIPKPYIHLAVSVPRFSKLDLIVEKSVELGIKEIHPFISELSFIRKASDFSESKHKRLNKIIESALAVSGRTEKPIFHQACTFQEIEVPKNHLALMAYIQERDKSLKSVLNSLSSTPEQIWLFVGSEGGFTEEESVHFVKQGGHLFSLGEQILRVETACLLALSALKYHYHIS